MSDEFSPRALVRSFSSDVQNRESSSQTQVKRICAEEVESSRRREQTADDWRVYFESWKPSEELEIP